ncbi:small ribosomal subunit biogenesis GTPase RsgA [Methylothermus subterraneus]
MSSVRCGRIVACFGREWAIEDADGHLALAYPAAKCEELPCVGDWVEWEATWPKRGRILKVLPRKTLLTRPGPRPAAANVDQVLVVLAPEPAYDLLLVDQYLVVCEIRKIAVCLVFNKLDKIPKEQRSRLLEGDLAPYRTLYPILLLSAKSGEGMDALRAALKGKTSMFAGQSGVGKSSLLRALIADQTIRIGELSARAHRGRHTTTSARLFHLPEGGDLIDTPGVLVFGLAGITPHQLALGYREFQPFIPRCRFADCRHADDLGCAVHEAVAGGAIDSSRYQRYLKLLAKLPQIS